MASYMGATDPLIDAEPGTYHTEVFAPVEIKGDPSDVPAAKPSILPLAIAAGAAFLLLKA